MAVLELLFPGVVEEAVAVARPADIVPKGRWVPLFAPVGRCSSAKFRLNLVCPHLRRVWLRVGKSPGPFEKLSLLRRILRLVFIARLTWRKVWYMESSGV